MAGSKEHNDYILMLLEWVEKNPDFNNFCTFSDEDGGLTHPDNIGQSRPDLYAIDDDNQHCIIGEAKTAIHGQTITDARALKQLETYFRYLKLFSKAILLIAVPDEHEYLARFEVGKLKKKCQFFGEVRYFTSQGMSKDS